MMCAVHTFESKWRVFYKEGSMIERTRSICTNEFDFFRSHISISLLMLEHDSSLQKHGEKFQSLHY